MMGTTLSHYEIREKLGAGGMGVVYRARDTKLGRDVAIKVLPEALSQDPERLSRFEREARLLASLNHPHVATLYGFEESSGTRFLIMELVEGETLADRIARHPLPIEEALPLFRQIAEGLEAAHEKGIIHRDLKPSNVKLTPEGKVKVLDFGLAKALASRESGPQSESPTVTRSPTESGVILGTAAYMSPEQARGKALDKRTDIWAFGCCLFEALTGRAAFLGETVSDTIAKILEREPPWGALPGRTPNKIRDLLARCLTKDPSMRTHDIADARIELTDALAEPEESPLQNKIVPIAAVATAVVSIAVALWSLTRAPEPVARSVVRSILPLPDGESLYEGESVAISPNGRYVAYVAGDRVYLRGIDELEARRVEGGEGADADTPFFSSDSEWAGFVKGQTVLRAAVSGGAPLRVSEVRGFAVGLDWRGDDIVLGDPASGLSRLPVAGGDREVLTVLHPERGELSHRFPQVLPGGDAVLFTIGTNTLQSWDDASIAVASMKTGEYKVVLEGGFHARYSPTGHLVYARSSTLFAVTFDLEDLEVTGRPVPVLRDVMTIRHFGGAAFALAENGSLVYAPGLSRTNDARVVWVDRDGRVEPLIETPRPFITLDLSPDGGALALRVFGGIDSIWLYEFERGTLTRWTSEGNHFNPVWAPNGKEIAFTVYQAGGAHLYKRAVDGGGKADLLAVRDPSTTATSWSPDGAVLLFNEYGVETGMDVWRLSLSGNGEPEPLLNGRANEMWAKFSPNGKWIAYQSDETGQFEIYVRPFPGGGDLRRVSTSGGDHPIWKPNGKELFYPSGDTMMAVPVETEVKLVLGRPTALFERRRNPAFPNFAVTPDGQRFIFIDDSVAEPAPTHLVLVQNFGEELKRLAPVKG
jgi:serine/threonine-protein kinase